MFRAVKACLLYMGFLCICSWSARAWAGEAQIQLPDGPGKDRVVGNCITCHSLDYIQMNSPFLDRAGWKAEIDKMKVKMGAPISDSDAPVILDYLVTHFSARRH